MSTYLLAWVVTDYTYEGLNYVSLDQRTISLRFYKTGEKNIELHDALKVTKNALEYFENYTHIPFPLAKLGKYSNTFRIRIIPDLHVSDSIAIPLYRSRGMEHYGLVIYQDHAIFSRNPFTSKLYHSIEAVLLICHEISHMWFGNLGMDLED